MHILTEVIVWRKGFCHHNILIAVSKRYLKFVNLRDLLIWIYDAHKKNVPTYKIKINFKTIEKVIFT